MQRYTPGCPDDPLWVRTKERRAPPRQRMARLAQYGLAVQIAIRRGRDVKRICLRSLTDKSELFKRLLLSSSAPRIMIRRRTRKANGGKQYWKQKINVGNRARLHLGKTHQGITRKLWIPRVPRLRAGRADQRQGSVRGKQSILRENFGRLSKESGRQPRQAKPTRQGNGGADLMGGIAPVRTVHVKRKVTE